MVGCHHGLDGQEFEQVLEMVKGREPCLVQVHRSAKSLTGLNELTTTHSSILAWDPMDTGAWQATVPGDLKEL